MNDTADIQEILAARAPAEDSCAGTETPASTTPTLPPSCVAVGNADLDDKAKAVLKELLKKSSWPRADYHTLVKKAGLMPWACFTILNEWALDSYGDVLLEGDNVLNINPKIRTQIHI